MSLDEVVKDKNGYPLLNIEGTKRMDVTQVLADIYKEQKVHRETRMPNI